MQMVNEYKGYDVIKSSWVPWIVCIVASFFFFYEFIQGNMFASIAGEIMQDFHIQADKMTYLSSIYYVSNVLFLFVAGYLLDRFSAKMVILIAMLLCVLSTFVLAHAHTFFMALCCRFATGIGSAFCFLGPVRIASRWFPSKKMAMVTGMIVTIAMTGGMLAQYPLTKLVIQIGWRESLMMVGWLGLGMFGIMSVWVKDRPIKKEVIMHQKTSLPSLLKQAYLNMHTVRAALYASLMNMAVAVLGAMMGSLYLVQRLGVSKEDAAMVNSMLFLGAIIGGPLIGWCSDKLGVRILPMKIGAFASLITVLAILYLPVSLYTMAVLFFLLGFFTAAQVISYALVAESNPASMTAMAVSTVSILTQGGYILYQNIYSAVLLHFGDMSLFNGVPTYSISAYQHAAIIFPLGIIIALGLIFGLKETYCHHEKGHVS